MTVVLVGTVVRLVLAPLALLSASAMLSALMLVPYFLVHDLAAACMAVASLQVSLLAVLEVGSAEGRRTVAALTGWGGQSVNFGQREMP